MTTRKVEFDELGFVVVRNVIPNAECKGIRQRILALLKEPAGPIEYEADLAYPGSPPNRDAEGGLTPRRILDAFGRGGACVSLAFNPTVISTLQTLLGTGEIALSRPHHNCIMTKHPKYSSDTRWHRDIRFWSYKEPELISVWFALQDESSENGSLRVIPRSHRLILGNNRFDESSFFCEELVQNQVLIDAAVNIDLRSGDVLFFHCQLLHSASRNHTSEIKVTPVFTYHSKSNTPIPGTRSASLPSVSIRKLRLA